MNSITYLGKHWQPSKVVCIGRNYVGHIEELDNEVPEQAVIFVKPNSAISDILQPCSTEAIHYEAEIAFLILGGQLKGVGFGLDLTKRELQAALKAKGLPWERAKGFDGAAVFSKFVDLGGDVNNLRLELEINGELTQYGGVKLMLNSPKVLLAEVQSFMSFEEGDILMTGTPSGVGVVNKGDVFLGRIFSDDELLVQQEWHV